MIEGAQRHEKRRAVCTIIARNFTASASALCKSVQRAHSDVDCFVLFIDGSPAEESDLFRSLVLDDIGNVTEATRFKYDLVELATSVKPLLLLHLLQTLSYDKVIFLDPDVWVVGDLDAIFTKLDCVNACLTPHIDEDFEDSEADNLDVILQCGLYNLGFFAVKDSPESMRLLAWWAAKLTNGCVADFKRPYFVDQRIMDLAPILFNQVEVVKNAGYNVAFWNLHSRTLRLEPGGWECNGTPLHFFHFSHFHITSGKFKRDLPMGSADVSEDVQQLCMLYREEVLKLGHETYSLLPYGYGQYVNGVAINYATRQEFRTNGDLQRQYPRPFSSPEISQKVRELLRNKALTGDCHEARLLISRGHRRQAAGQLMKAAAYNPSGVFTKTFLGSLRLFLRKGVSDGAATALR